MAFEDDASVSSKHWLLAMLIFHFTVCMAIRGDEIKIYNQIIILLLITNRKTESIVLLKCYMELHLSWFAICPEDDSRF